MPLISQVVAMAENRVIGRDNALPWHLPADLAHFKRVTMGKPIVMGRKAFEAIGRPLPGRHNIVMTRNPNYTAPGCSVVHSREQAIAAAGAVEEIAVIGGEDIYRLFLPITDLIHLTVVHAEIDGDTWYPALDETAWRTASQDERPADDKNPYRMTFTQLRRA
ncbi:MAG TPA: dihydrofolate reductase [Gammaproteobacteria bacterium]|nr:dihydrofolate reductase [Gammaproteobacteria bacterium]